MDREPVCARHGRTHAQNEKERGAWAEQGRSTCPRPASHSEKPQPERFWPRRVSAGRPPQTIQIGDTK